MQSRTNRFSRRSALKLMGGAAAAAGTPGRVSAAAPGKFDSSWESLAQYRCPEWFRNAKFGIWSHWGPQSVPEAGDWYARNMYIQGSRQYEHHVKHYGHPSKKGYKDIVVLWKAEKFDPEHLMQLYKAAGARYFVSQAVHHDNWDNWNSKHHRWNAVKMGPRKDIVGLWRKAALKHGLRFGVTEHLERSWSWFNVNKGHDTTGPLAGVPYDGNDPRYVDFYFPPHADTTPHYPVDPPDSWKQEWFNRIQDVVDNYEPDLLYTDGGIPFGDIGRSLVAHFYNQNMRRHGGKLEAVYTIKKVTSGGHGDYRDGVAVLDLERGVVSDIHKDPWQTDTSVGDWFYRTDDHYKSADSVIDELVDIVSKNGNLLLNFPQRPDGTLDAANLEVLAGLSRWMPQNSEAIYDTRPWETYGEGPTQTSGGMFSERHAIKYTGSDLRFTTKGRTLYATCLEWPGSEVLIKSLPASRRLWLGEIGSVRMLGVNEALKFSRDGDGRKVQVPDPKPGDYAYVLKIEGRA